MKKTKLISWVFNATRKTITAENMVYFLLFGQDFKLTNFLQKLKQELRDAGKAWTDLESAKKKDELEIKVHLIIWLE